MVLVVCFGREFMANAIIGYFRSGTMVKSSFCGVVMAFTILALLKYPGAAYAYLLFTVAFNALLLFGFRQKRLFFDTFIGMFFWLGFWMKFTYIIVFMNTGPGEPIGEFNFTAAAYDYALNVSSLGAIAFLLAGLFRERFFSYPAANAGQDLSALDWVYSRFKKPIWALFVLGVLAVTVSNAYLGIYQKGLPPRTVLPFGLSGIYSLSLLFGLASLSAVLLNCEFKFKSSPYLVSLLALFECFFSNCSMYSRGMILNGSALILGAAQNARMRGMAMAGRFKIIVVGLFFFMFAASILGVNHLRTFVFEMTDAGSMAGSGMNSPEDIINSTSLPFFVNRWVGVEGVMAVTSYDKRGWDFWREAWRERYNSVGTSLYDRTVAVRNSLYLKNTATKHFISLPGIIAFFCYPGSLVFQFVSLFALGLFGALFEVLVYKLGGANIILCALMGQVIAGRYAHFGYVPRQSYLLVGGILIVAVGVFVLNKASARFFPAAGLPSQNQQ